MNFIFKSIAAAAAFMLAGSAAAASGATSVDDATLAGFAADAYVYADNWNPHAGQNGDTSGFGTTFNATGSAAWSVLGKHDANESSLTSGNLSFGFNPAGTWSVTNTAGSAVKLDLVLAIHAGGQAAGWLFDDETILAGQTLNGTWKIDWTVGNKGNNPDFSNLTVFGRDALTSPVPEPETYAMLLAGLAAIGALRLRQRRA